MDGHLKITNQSLTGRNKLATGTWKFNRLAAIASFFLIYGCSAPQELPPPVDSDGDGVYDHLDTCPNSPAGSASANDGCPRDSDGDGVPDYLDECPDTAPGVAACNFGCPLADPIVINLVNDEFDFDKSDLKPDMISALNALIEDLKDNPEIVDLTVVGHTDNIGTEEYNNALSLRRAQSVVGYLKANGLGHVSFMQLGQGESQPVADNSTKEGRALNRRVEIFTHSDVEHCCSSTQEPAGITVALMTRPSNGWLANGE